MWIKLKNNQILFIGCIDNLTKFSILSIGCNKFIIIINFLGSKFPTANIYFLL